MSSNKTENSLLDREYEYSSIICILILIGVSILVIVPTVFLSFHVVRYHQVAFVRDVYGGVDTSQILTNGRYFYPLTKTLVYFDINLVQVTFLEADDNPLSVFLDNGVEIGVDLSFFYRVDLSRLPELYSKYATSYDSRVDAIATATIKNTVTQFTENDYIGNRDYVQSIIANALAVALSSEVFVIVPQDQVQLLRVYFPDNVVKRNLESAIELQNNQLAQLQQAVIITDAETARLVAAVTAQTHQILALASIQGNQIVSTAQNAASNALTNARADGLAVFFQETTINSSESKAAIIQYFNLIDNPNQQKIVSIPATSTLVQV